MEVRENGGDKMRELKRLKNDQIKAMVAKALKQGGELRDRGGDHVQVACPWKGTDRCVQVSSLVTVACSPSDHRVVRNTRSDLRKCGFQV